MEVEASCCFYTVVLSSILAVQLPRHCFTIVNTFNNATRRPQLQLNHCF